VKSKLAVLSIASVLACGVLAAPLIAAPTTASAFTVIVAPGPPPALVYEPVPPGRPGWVWVRGHWAWNGARWFWVRGYWARAPRYRAVWVPGYWAHRARGWVWIEGYWR
jgi:hypothetical protein